MVFFNILFVVCKRYQVLNLIFSLGLDGLLWISGH